MWFVIRENERALVWRDGKVLEWLEPGRHLRLGWGRALSLEVFSLDAGWVAWTPEREAMFPAEAVTALEVPVGHCAIVERNGIPLQALEPGRYLVWTLRHEWTTKVYDLRPPLIEVEAPHLPLLPPAPVRCIRVKPWMKVMLFVDGRHEATLDEGLHVVGAYGKMVDTTVVDLRTRERQIVGQEVMTKDQVTLRLSLVVQFRVIDVETMAGAVPDFEDALYTEAQLVARHQVASLTVDELLGRRAELKADMTTGVAASVAPWGVEVTAVDIKDVVLPGEMKALLNRVIEAEKQAAAQVILRREETAATRSMANTARMLEQNPMLLRLKELEATKELAGQVKNLTVVAGAPDWLRMMTDAKGEDT